MTKFQRTNVFVSYSRHDGSLVAPVVKLLRANRTLVFQDIDSIQPGKRWRVETDKALYNSNLVVLFWCQHSSKSSEVQRELQAAIDQGKDLLPLLLDETVLPKELTEFEWIDFRETVGSNHTSIAEPEETQEDYPSASAPNYSPKRPKPWRWVAATGIVAGLALGISFLGFNELAKDLPVSETSTEPGIFPQITQGNDFAMPPSSVMVVSLIIITIALIILSKRRVKSKYENSLQKTEYSFDRSKIEAKIASEIEVEILRRTTR